MYSKGIFALGAFLSVAAAVPLQHIDKRDVVWTTDVQMAYTTVQVTTTVFYNAGETPKAHYGHHHRSKVTSHIKSTVTVAPASPSESGAAAESSPYVAPAPTSETPAAAAPTTSTWVAPTTATTPEASPSPSAQPSSSGGGSSSGGSYSGDITYYTPGLGSCGTTSTDSDMIVAVAEDLMKPLDGQNPNTNPWCGKSITITYGGVSAQATIVDTCPGCSGGSLDLSPALFQKFAKLSVGRVSGVSWSFD